VAVLELDHASKSLGDLRALDRCSFLARPGRLTGFLGPNGAGKTTAMRAVFGLVVLDSGGLRWEGRPVSAAERGRFGYMPEERGLYPRTRSGISRCTWDCSAAAPKPMRPAAWIDG
jgi:ABC-2 type transport system ATP-binding protein